MQDKMYEVKLKSLTNGAWIPVGIYDDLTSAEYGAFADANIRRAHWGRYKIECEGKNIWERAYEGMQGGALYFENKIH